MTESKSLDGRESVEARHPTPWSVHPDLRSGVHRPPPGEMSVPTVVGWNIYDVYGRTVVGEEGMMADQGSAARLIADAVNQRAAMIEALREAERQIEYLHEKFQATGTGEAVLARIQGVLASAA